MHHSFRSPRRRTLKGGRIFFHAAHPGVSCVLKNLSEEGAKFIVHDIDWVPTRFDLHIDLDGRKVGCKMAWHRDNEIGVYFVNDWTQVKQAQIQSLQVTRPLTCM